jgi:hypothetical protein
VNLKLRLQMGRAGDEERDGVSFRDLYGQMYKQANLD